MARVHCKSLGLSLPTHPEALVTWPRPWVPAPGCPPPPPPGGPPTCEAQLRKGEPKLLQVLGGSLCWFATLEVAG